MRSLFLDPAARTVFVNWDEVADLAVCEFRKAAGDLDDPRWRALFDELSAGSERFRELWARADVGYSTGLIHARHRRRATFVSIEPGSTSLTPAGRCW
jgi:hypothetical protein